MGDSTALDDLFRQAVAVIDAGDVPGLSHQIAAPPRLVSERLDNPGRWLHDKVGTALDTFFQRPYLLWFVAEDPVRNGALPSNIAGVTHAIIRAAQDAGVADLREQLDYALRLVSWSWIARQCDVQIALIDVLVDAGAGANLGARDTAYDGTPLDWAEYSGGKPQYDAIATYLRRHAEADRSTRRAT